MGRIWAIHVAPNFLQCTMPSTWTNSLRLNWRRRSPTSTVCPHSESAGCTGRARPESMCWYLTGWGQGPVHSGMCLIFGSDAVSQDPQITLEIKTAFKFHIFNIGVMLIMLWKEQADAWQGNVGRAHSKCRYDSDNDLGHSHPGWGEAFQKRVCVTLDRELYVVLTDGAELHWGNLFHCQHTER